MEINKNDPELEDEDDKNLEQFMRASQSAIDLFQEELSEESEVQKAKDIEYEHFLMTKKLFLAEKKFYTTKVKNQKDEMNLLKQILLDRKIELNDYFVEHGEIVKEHKKKLEAHKKNVKEHRRNSLSDLAEIKEKKLTHEEAKTKFENQFENDQKVQDYCWDRFLDHVNTYEQAKEDHDEQVKLHAADKLNLEKELEDHNKNEEFHNIQEQKLKKKLKRIERLANATERRVSDTHENHKKWIQDSQKSKKELSAKQNEHKEREKQHKENVRRASQEISAKKMNMMVIHDAVEHSMEISIKEQEEKTKRLDEKCKDLESLENKLKPTIGKIKKNNAQEAYLEKALENHRRNSREVEEKVMKTLKKNFVKS